MSLYLPNPMRYNRYMQGENGSAQPAQSPIADAINSYTKMKLSGPSAAQNAELGARTQLYNEQARGTKMKNDSLSQFGNIVGDLLKQQPNETPEQHSDRLSQGIAQFAPMMGPQAVKALQDGLATTNAYGGPDQMRRALVLQGKDPGVNFAGTRAEADSVAARNNANEQSRQIAVKGVPTRGAIPVTPALAAQMDQMVEHAAPGIDPATKALILNNASTAYQGNPNAISAIQGAISSAGTVTPPVSHWYGDTPASFVPNAPAVPAPAFVGGAALQPPPLPSAAPAPQALVVPKSTPAPDSSTAPTAPVITGTPQEGAPADQAPFAIPPINQRKQGGVYNTPNGLHTWTGTGWTPTPLPPGGTQ